MAHNVVSRILTAHNQDAFHVLLVIEVAAADRIVAVGHEFGRQLLGRVVNRWLRKLLEALLHQGQLKGRELAAAVVLSGLCDLLGDNMQPFVRGVHRVRHQMR